MLEDGAVKNHDEVEKALELVPRYGQDAASLNRQLEEESHILQCDVLTPALAEPPLHPELNHLSLLLTA